MHIYLLILLFIFKMPKIITKYFNYSHLHILTFLLIFYKFYIQYFLIYKVLYFIHIQYKQQTLPLTPLNCLELLHEITHTNDFLRLQYCLLIQFLNMNIFKDRNSLLFLKILLFLYNYYRLIFLLKHKILILFSNI